MGKDDGAEIPRAVIALQNVVALIEKLGLKAFSPNTKPFTALVLRTEVSA